MTRTAHTRLAAPPTPDVSPGGGEPAPLDQTGRLAGRTTHPWAWWGWAVTAAIAASFTTNPLLLALIITAVLLVTVARRSDAPWARSVSAYLVLALTVILFRVVLMVVLGGAREGLVLFTLPEVQLPGWLAGIRLGGPVTLNAILAAGYDGLRLAAIVICVGAANALANPRQALKTVPAALNQLSVAVVIALSVAPQLIESLGRVRRARRLRGGAGKGLRAVTSILVPVMEDALERSMRLATGMESRGYGRTIHRPQRRATWLVSTLLVLALLLLVGSTYALFALPEVRVWALVGMTVSVGAALGGLHLSGRNQRISRYRPHPWRWQDTAVVLLGLAAAVVIGWLANTNLAVLYPSTSPLEWPPLTAAMLLAVALVAAPLALTEPAPEASR